jgi:hypothetical protein
MTEPAWLGALNTVLASRPATKANNKEGLGIGILLELRGTGQKQQLAAWRRSVDILGDAL